MNAHIIDNIDISYLNERWLAEDGRIKLLPASEFRSVPNDHLRLWLHHQARYCLPTVELVEWLRAQIGGAYAVELGCGNGDLYHHLKITGVDSCIQNSPMVAAFMRMLGQVPTHPHKDVVPMNAENAVLQLRPRVAIACYLTRKFIQGVDQEGVSHASMYGVREEAIIDHVPLYIHIGNRMTHGDKTVLSLPHDELRFPWLVTRGHPDHDVIYVWKQ